MALLVLLDIDQTLVHSARHHCSRFAAFYLEKFELYVHVRPYCMELLRILTVHPQVTLGFYTAACKDYAGAILDRLFQMAGLKNWQRHIQHVFTREHTYSVRDDVCVKSLPKIARLSGWDLSHVMLVDDNRVHANVRANVGHIYFVPPFTARPLTDSRDETLADFLDAVVDAGDKVKERILGPPLSKRRQFSPTVTQLPPMNGDDFRERMRRLPSFERKRKATATAVHTPLVHTHRKPVPARIVAKRQPFTPLHRTATF